MSKLQRWIYLVIMAGKNKVLLHLMEDSVFAGYIIEKFEKANQGRNHYVLLQLMPSRAKHVRKSDFVDIIPLFSIKIFRFIALLRKSETLLVHYMTPLKALFIFLCPKKVTVIWFMWGGDFYGTFNALKKNLYKPLTRKLIKEKMPLKFFTREIVSPVFNKLFNPILSVMKRIKYNVPVFYEDYELLLRQIRWKPVYLPFSYAEIGPQLSNSQRQHSRQNILLGNSAHPSNNHLDILQTLSGFNLESRKIITPLSYGSRKYAQLVMENCPDKLKSNFMPLKDFMPRDEYFSLVNSCGIAVFNFKRQQGMGNIIELLYNGCKVFLNEDTTTWAYLGRLGVKVFSIEKELIPENLMLFDPVYQGCGRRENVDDQ